ncbi:AT-rich interactive domain-containing protein 4B isoform X1 [Acanthochromis polyacanthus]|uniref:AT-rich interactive domain-containing protein 4B isoform X1 n=1 Tax=Acanthochromis polyacanthus TaxID=80966 RepID=UPI002234787D|nr:AT-rich interactive domain-containing protein 4B isoform X1 [Acanthochromis polyacanthus]
MKTLEEPPYLTVGTDVSAKYRGAFCEAKIKTAKRLVKAKVTFKPDLSTAEVHDENIKGPLKVGAVVEVKNQDGVYQEATINKLTDASIYTVVFDDGDEKTLRRSSLCLKGARHFAESETLDRLPLTNPEHFGTPVIGKKGNRGRRSNPIQEEELSSSSSEEEESDQRQNEDLFGKVVCVEGVATGDKKKTTWYPALVISPDCHEDMTVKKDNIFVRSFKDGKFYMVLRKDVREMSSDCPPKADAGLKPALDAALEFQQQLVVPSTWKTEVKEESSSSEEDDEDEEEEQEEDASGEEEEEEVEPFPEERENFLQQLYKFMEDRGTPINKRPVLGYRNLNLFKLYRLVHKLGGFDNIESGSVWKQVYQDLGIPVLNSAAGYNVKCAYRKYLYGFEEYCTSTAITFRMDLPLKQGPKGEVKSEQETGGTAAPTSSNSEEQKAQVDGESCSAQSVVCKDEKPDLTRNKMESEPPKTEGKDSRNDDDDEEEGPHKADADEGSSTSRLGADAMKQERDEEQESKDNSGDDSSQEGEEGEEFECYPPGMKVQVRYGRGRNLKTYEATVKEADVEGGEVLYLVHYCGWNVRYDEWIKADKIVRPANKNVPKIKHRKKIKNKTERERDRLERLNDREVLGPSPNANRVPRSKCGLSQDVFSKMDEGEDKGTQQSPVKSIEITSILNGLQASEMSTDESEHEQEDEEGEHNEEDGPGCRGSLRKGPPEPPQISEHWESGAPSEGPKPSPVSGKNQDVVSTDNADVSKRRNQPETEGEASTRKRKSDGAAERTPKGQSKAKTRNTRSADWLPGGSPRKLEERAAGPGEERGASSSSSSDDESPALAESQAEESERSRPKTKGSPSKKYNGMKEKTKAGRQGGFWEIPEKRAKVSGNAEERAAVRPKGQKDVWSSIQAQWPKKTLKELFSDSDTEAANSPPPPVPSCLEEPNVEQDAGPEDEASEEQMENDKLQEFPSSGSNSVLNTPPTTPESPSGGGSAVEDSGQAQPSSPPPSIPPALPSEPVSEPLPPGPIQEEVAGGRSETDSSTVEVESLGGELQELPQDEGAGSPSKVFDVSLSCNSSSSCSLELSNSSQQESEQKSKASASQKRQKESQTGGASKKHKPNRKSLGVPPKKNRKTANSSDSEDQSVVEGTAKPTASKNNTSELKAATSPKCHGRSPPSSHKYHKQGDDHTQHRDHGRSPRVYKWSFQMSDLEKMSSLERISFLQEKLQDIRNHYLSLKSEVASIDRRRKRMKKKERESTVAASSSSSSSSSSPSSSSLTAAVMLTLADPPVSSSSSSSQNSGVSVECR